MKIKGSFAKSYDRFVKRQSLLPPGLLELVRSTEAREILEFASGTGTVAVGLALEGFKVTGVDYSPEMLKAARLKARERRARVEFVLGDITRMSLKRQFDLVLCLGNTIPYFTNRSTLRQFLESCTRHLRPGGQTIFQQLNYDRVLKDRPATFAVDVDRELIRFKQYRYRRRLIDFVVTMVDGTRIPPQATTSVVKMMPWTRKELAQAMRESGFREVKAYGDYLRQRFTLESKDLLVQGRL